jgi:hypothetical protein
MRRKLIYLVCAIVLLAVVESRAWATPPCWPADPLTTKVFNVPAGVSTYKQLATWECGGQIHSMYFDWIEVAAYLQRWAAGAMTTADADAGYNAKAEQRPATASEAQFSRFMFVDHHGLEPVVMAEGVAYKKRQAEGVPDTFIAIGTVPPGTTCAREGVAGGYMPVPRASVKLASKFATYPQIAYARCG